MLDPYNRPRAFSKPPRIYQSNASFEASASMANSNVSVMVAAATLAKGDTQLRHDAPFGNREFGLLEPVLGWLQISRVHSFEATQLADMQGGFETIGEGAG